MLAQNRIRTSTVALSLIVTEVRNNLGAGKTDAAALVVAAAAARYRARGGDPVWTYTHAWRDVARESWGQLSIFASCETAADVVEAGARGYAKVLLVEPAGLEPATSWVRYRPSEFS